MPLTSPGTLGNDIIITIIIIITELWSPRGKAKEGGGDRVCQGGLSIAAAYIV